MLKILYEKTLFWYNFAMERQKIKLLGFRIDSFGFEEAIDFAKDLIEAKQSAQVVTINPEMIEYALKHPDFADVLDNADLVIPDGVGVKLGLKIKGFNVERIAGIEFSFRMLQECAKNKFPVALIGARPHILNKTVENLKTQIQDLNVIYSQNGYFQDREKILKELKDKSPRFVLVALGSPRQEEFIIEARKLLPKALMIGVGGSFDVWAGEAQRAPEVFQKLGLEWFYRTLKEPKRFKRIFPTLPRFLLRVIFSH